MKEKEARRVLRFLTSATEWLGPFIKQEDNGGMAGFCFALVCLFQGRGYEMSSVWDTLTFRYYEIFKQRF